MEFMTNTIRLLVLALFLSLAPGPVCAAPQDADTKQNPAPKPESGAKQKDATPPDKQDKDDTEKFGAVAIAGVSVKGLTALQARGRLLQKLDAKLNRPVILANGPKIVTRKRRDLGVGLDVAGMVAQAKGGATRVPLRFKADRAKLQRALRALAPALSVPAQNTVITERGGRVTIRPGQQARVVDAPGSAQTLADLLAKNPTATTLPLRVTKRPGKVAANKLKGIDARLSRFVTKFKTAAVKRVNNMRIAIQAIDGTVLAPGQIYSMNATVGERTQARGYRTAPVIEYGKLVPGIGGGVSQVTGTLFNAVLVAGLPILEYHTHAEPIPYLPIGRDATVAWKRLDMRFKNDTPAPIYIDYHLVNNRAIATLYGAKSARRQTRIVVNAQRLGPRRAKAALYRIVKRNGAVVKKELVGRSNYDWKPASAD